MLGPSMKAPDELMSLSVFQHVPVIGAADQSSSGLVILGACALVLLGASFPAFRRRDIG